MHEKRTRYTHHTMTRLTISIILSVLLPTIAYAWGGDGHQIVCLIAEDRLTPAAHSLLGSTVNISDAEIASWADQVRRERQETGPWHYVDIPFDAKSFDEKRDGKNGNNVIDKINDCQATLKDLKASKNDRVEALKFLVHFVGDEHQPLHCAERNGDKGGNGRLVFFLDRPRATNLHSVWDTAILLTRKGTTRNAAYADTLNARIKPEQAAEWEKGTPADWANESHKVAVEIVYRDIPADGPPPKLDKPYVDAGGLVIEQQLQRGGVRLAMILNNVFKESPMTKPAAQ